MPIVDKKVIGIDARLYGPLGKGLGRYVQEVVDGVIRIDNENRYVIFLSPGNFDSFFCPNENTKKVLVKSRWYTIAEQFELPYLMLKHKIGLMHIPHFNVPIFCPVKFVVTIHDLILTKFPSQRASTLSPIIYKIKYLGYRFGISMALKRAKRIIAVSNFTKRDIIDQFGVDGEKIEMIYEGVSHKLQIQFKGNQEQVLEKYAIKKPFIMYVGNAYPHKNIEGLIKEFSSLPDKYEDLSLVLVGGEDYFYKRIKQSVQNEKIRNVIFAGYVPDEDLAGLYATCDAYVFASRYEGFGLPPLEAMSQSCPVLSSDRSCMREILGEAAIYFNPDKNGWLIEAMQKLKTIERNELIERGKRQILKYDWKKCAEKTVAVYKRFI